MSYIVPMEKPKRCGLCPCFHAEHPMHCQAIKASKDKRIIAPYGAPIPDWCPLVELPEKHGRLVDADKLADLLSKEKEKVVGEGNLFLCFAVGFAWGFITKEPTVVEAEGSEK